VASLLQLTQGALHLARPPWSATSPNQGGAPLHARLRYFDPKRRRAGLPEDVAALIDSMSADRTGVTLVNLSPSVPREVIVQGGAYGEHRIESIRDAKRLLQVHGRCFTVRLEPGCGARFEITMNRYASAPTLKFPWA
jgi:hypothetical protein